MNWHETEGHSSETEGLLKQLLHRPDRPAEPPPAAPAIGEDVAAAKAAGTVEHTQLGGSKVSTAMIFLG